MPLDEDVRAYLERQRREAEDATPLTESTPAEVRADVAAQRAQAVAPTVAEVQDLTLPGPAGPIPARLYHPLGVNGAPPLVTYLHGGGFVVGDLDSHDAAARRLCDASGAVVVSLAYRLAPEHPFPAAVHDAEAALRAAAERAEAWHADPQRLAVAGDSAGATLATVVCRRLRDAGGPTLLGQVLAYPVVDLRMDGRRYPSRRRYAEGYGLTSAMMGWFRNHYLASEEMEAHPDASPILADDLSGLPPALLLTAGYDLLTDEGVAYAARLTEAGVSVEHIHLPGAIHGVLSHPELLRCGQQGWERIGAWLRNRF